MKRIIPIYLRAQEAKEKLQSMIKNEEGATMVEYALMVALIAVVALAGAQLLGQNILATFNGIAANITAP